MRQSVWVRALRTFLRAAVWAAITVLGAIAVGLAGVPAWAYAILWIGFAITDWQSPGLHEFFPKVPLFSWLVWTLVYTPIVMLTEPTRARHRAEAASKNGLQHRA